MTSHAWPVESGAARFLRALAALLFFISAGGNAIAAGAHGSLPAPADLAADGMQAAARGKPLVILFSLPGCSFCDVVRQHYLLPLMRELPERQQPVIREVQVTGSGILTGFNRERISHHALAMRYGVRFAPTVLFLDGAGNILTPPIVGGDTAGLYGGYLDNAFAEASRKLTKGRRAETSGE